MTSIFEVIQTRECQKNWSRLEEFFTMISDIGTGGLAQAEYLISRKNASIVVELCDLILQKRSPKAKADSSGEQRVEMGGSASRAPFGPLVKLLCQIVRCMNTPKFDEQAKSLVKTFKIFDHPWDTKLPK